MVTIVVAIHVVICLALVIVILLQQGKGAEIGAVFGGSSQTVFGASGAGNVLTKATWAMAAMFFATSIFLAYASTRRFTGSIFGSGGGVNRRVVVPPKPMVPLVPAAPVGPAGRAPAGPVSQGPLSQGPAPAEPVPAAPASRGPIPMAAPAAPRAPANHVRPLAPKPGP
jgi:preprotein translocase subunit SecG